MVLTANRRLLGALLLLVPILSGAGPMTPPAEVSGEPGVCPIQEANGKRRPISLQRCDSGGTGARHCEAGEGINPMGVHSGCGISCQEGYYACCRRGDLFSDPSCLCVKTPSYPYTPALRPLRGREE